MALAQSEDPTKRGVTVWVETDGAGYWSTAKTVIPNHGDGTNRNDNKYLDNARPITRPSQDKFDRRRIRRRLSGCCKAGDARGRGLVLLVQFLQERYDIPAKNIYAHNWIDYKDGRYCEGCDLAAARAQTRPMSLASESVANSET